MNWLQKIAQIEGLEIVARRNIDDEFSRDFLYNQPNDEFLYHVTSADSIDSILTSGLTGNNPPMFESGIYPRHSRGRVFLTERYGLSFWDDRVEQQLRDRFDSPPDIVIFRIPKVAVQNSLQEDIMGTNDAIEPSFFIEDTEQQDLSSTTQGLKILGFASHVN